MNENLCGDPASEAILSQAVFADFERELKEYLSAEEANPTPVSENLDRRVAALIRRGKRNELMRKAFLYARRAASAAAALIICAGAFFMASPEVRASMKAALFEWYDKYVKFGSAGSGEAAGVWEPSYIPDGFAETSRASVGNIVSVSYSDAGGETLSFAYVPADNSMSVNNEGVKYGQVLENGVVYHTFEAESGDYVSSVVWDMGGCRFYAAARLPMSELLEMARSVAQK